MAYGRRRSTYRRKGRRGNRTLSTRRIFNNKGAKAQAAQIYALRKSVSRIARANRPEMKVQYTTTANRGFGYGPGCVIDPQIINMPGINQGTGDGSRIGNIVKIYPLKVNTALFYETVINSRLGYPPFSELRDHGGQVRFIALQVKSAVDNPPALEDVFREVTVDGTINSSMMMRMPFKTGITSRYHILKNSVFSLSECKPQFSATLKVVPKIRTISWEDGFTYPRGNIWLIWLASGMVQRTSEEGEQTIKDYNTINVTWRMELPFTDA